MDEQGVVKSSPDDSKTEEKGASEQQSPSKKPVYTERNSADKSKSGPEELNKNDSGVSNTNRTEISSPVKKTLPNRRSPTKKPLAKDDTRAGQSQNNDREIGTSNSDKSDVSSPTKKAVSRKRIPPSRKPTEIPSNALPKDILDYPRLEPYKVHTLCIRKTRKENSNENIINGM